MLTLTKKQAYCKDICRAWCCKHLVFSKEFITQDDKLFFALRGVLIDPSNNNLVINSRCRWVNNHNMCLMYERRPQSCKDYECDVLKKQFPLQNHEKTKDDPSTA